MTLNSPVGNKRELRTVRNLILLAAVFLAGCHKPIKAPHSVQRPHFAAMTAAAGIQVSVTLTYEDLSPFAGTCTITDDTGMPIGSYGPEVASANFDATGAASALFAPDPAAIYSAHLYDATGLEVVGPLPILTVFFDLSQINSFTLKGTIRKADNVLIQPYSLSAP